MSGIDAIVAYTGFAVAIVTIGRVYWLEDRVKRLEAIVGKAN